MTATCPHCSATITPEEAGRLMAAIKPRKPHDPNARRCRCMDCRDGAKGKPKGPKRRES